MSTNRKFYLLILLLFVAVIPLTACSSLTGVTPTATPDPKQALVGSWTATITKEDILRVMPAFDKQYLCDNTGTFIWKFHADGTFTGDQSPLPDCPASANPHTEDKWSADGNLVTLAGGTPNQEIYEIALAGDHFTLKAKSSDCIPCIAVNTAKPWTRVE